MPVRYRAQVVDTAFAAEPGPSEQTFVAAVVVVAAGLVSDSERSWDDCSNSGWLSRCHFGAFVAWSPPRRNRHFS